MKRISGIALASLAALAVFSCTKSPGPATVEKITVTPDEVSMKTGETMSLECLVTPPDATAGKIFWKSSAPRTVTVNDLGKISALGTGEALIIAETEGLCDTCNVTVTAGEPRTGDFYYSDGTYSTELDPEKIPIGIVFYTGDPTADDEYLKSEHPSCKNGLAVSLYTAGKCAWQASSADYGTAVDGWIGDNAPQFYSILVAGEYDDGMERISGFNNTEALKAFNAAPENSEYTVNAAQMAADFIAYSYPPSPENSSDWYLPSIKELSILCSGIIGAPVWANQGTENKTFINSVIEQLPPEYGAQGLTDAYYWASTERDGMYAYYQQFSTPGFSYYVDKNIDKMIAVRCILAF